ncbi:hypothetical protein N7520_007588 [Penicillium odoratum]|uniref:uncharacterized protein n=1 Tax=Penicillium odoratum TaxID=1167516 RepID=UPI002546AEB1|nr:uncharacterized protein N7520_007588 [Penicillium odoratum]KAJ5760432.1 hypothetical protein N7520_007588 [Penicillium odoratum]
MSDFELRAKVTLLPLGTDYAIAREFTLSDTNYSIMIGRASKRGLKNRFADPENGWFDSRVMSRDHAELHMEPGKMVLNIDDLASTHGTWLNNNRLISGESTPLLSGDILRFGVDVERGEDVFPALVVRCKVDWSSEPKYVTPQIWSSRTRTDVRPRNTQNNEITASKDSFPASELKAASASRQTSTNTFCVPEDDSDVDEVIQIHESYKEPQDTHVDEVKTMISPALTSEAQDTSVLVNCQSGGLRKHFPPPYSVPPQFIIDQQQQCPSRTFTDEPPLNGEMSDYPRFGVKLDKDNWSSEVEKELKQAFDEQIEEGDSEFESESSESSSYGYNVENEFGEEELDNLLLGSSDLEEDSVAASSSGAEYEYASEAESASEASDASSDSDDASHGSSEESLGEENEKECIDPTLLTQYQLGAEEAVTTIPVFTRATLNPSSEPQPKSNDMKHHTSNLHGLQVRFPKCPINSLLNGAPSQISHQGDDVNARDLSTHTENLQIPGYAPYRDGPFSCDPVDKEIDVNEWKDRPKLSLKRKAFEMETQDAQLPELIVPPSEDLSLNTTQQSQVATAITSALSEIEPSSKRVKSSHSSNLGTYTATAVVSALLGGLGTIALLAALPAEYFQ